jgi:hypothetical protein
MQVRLPAGSSQKQKPFGAPGLLASFLIVCVIFIGSQPSCKKSTTSAAMEPIVSLRDALAAGKDARDKAGPACTEKASAQALQSAEMPACCNETAKRFGAPWANVPDNATAAAAAAMLISETGGNVVGHCLPLGLRPGGNHSRWQNVIRDGRGTGADALRLAVLRAADAERKVWNKTIESESDLRSLFAAAVHIIPGTCQVYADLRTEAGQRDLLARPPEYSIDHSACVTEDLKRRTGPGPRYGYALPIEQSIWRAGMAALIALREVATNLRLGLEKHGSLAKKYDAELSAFELGVSKLEIHRVQTAPEVDFRDVHMQAGIPFTEGTHPTLPHGSGDAGVPTKATVTTTATTSANVPPASGTGKPPSLSSSSKR